MRKPFAAILLASLFASHLFASMSMGKEIYAQKCIQCHNAGKAMASTKSSEHWKNLYKDKGKKLAGIHLNTDEAKASWEYFKTEVFKDESRDLKDFMLKYSRDKSKHTSCH